MCRFGNWNRFCPQRAESALKNLMDRHKLSTVFNINDWLGGFVVAAHARNARVGPIMK
jgi:hypothetical protein